MNNLPADILTRIFGHVSLETAIALDQTCKSFQTLFTALDDTVVRDKVLKRVPWMKINEPGTGLSSWRLCSLLIASRRRSMTKTPKKWTSLNKSNTTKLLKNTHIEYLPHTNINGKSLPDTFKPMFETAAFKSPVGIVRGKYMSIQGETTLDAVSFDYFKKMPVEDPIPTIWSGLLQANKEHKVKCPLSGIEVTGTKSFRLWQESDRWLVLSSGSPEVMYIVDKEQQSEGELFFHKKLATMALPADYEVQLLPGNQGAFILEFLTQEKLVRLSYVDLAKNTDIRALGTFPGTKDDYWYVQFTFRFAQYKTDETREEKSRDFVVPYGGMLWVQYKEKTLIPLWVDVGEGNDTDKKPKEKNTDLKSSVPNNTTSIRIRPSGATSLGDHNHSFRVAKSPGGRMVAQHHGSARMIGDLATGTTYIVEDDGYQNRTGICFVSQESGAVPKFYTIDIAWARALEVCWMDPEERGGNWDESEDGQKYTKENCLVQWKDDYECDFVWEDNKRVEKGCEHVTDQDEVDGELNKEVKPKVRKIDICMDDIASSDEDEFYDMAMRDGGGYGAYW